MLLLEKLLSEAFSDPEPYSKEKEEAEELDFIESVKRAEARKAKEAESI